VTRPVTGTVVGIGGGPARLADESRSICRFEIPELVRTHYFREYSFAWFGILAVWGFRTRPPVLTWSFYAARSYSLMRPPRTGLRFIRFRERSAAGCGVPEVCVTCELH